MSRRATRQDYALPVIALDPGHGGHGKKDSRGCSLPQVGPYAQIDEADWNLDMCLRVVGIHRYQERPYKLHLLRASDVLISYAERNARAIKAGAELIISVHANASVDYAVSGCMAFYWPGNRVTRKLGDYWLTQMPGELRDYRRSAESVPAEKDTYPRARFNIAQYRESCLLCECGFASNPRDARLLRQSTIQHEIARSILATCEHWITGDIHG